MTSADIQRHLIEELVPLWHEWGVDRERGGYHDCLDLELKPVRPERKGLLVTARHIYVYSHAYLAGAPSWALEDARHGYAFLKDRLWNSRRGAWFNALEASGRPADSTLNTYNYAFILFAMAYFSRASGDPDALRTAGTTLDILDSRLADGKYGGFFESASEDGDIIRRPRRQNPHMHLLEAFLALHESTGDRSYLARADGVIDLFMRHFYDPAHGCLGEYFLDDWRPQPSPIGDWVEPGHHFEWVWLLHRYAGLSGRKDALEPAGRLHDFAIRYGIDPADGAAFDGLDRKGNITSSNKQVWPQTEYVKALAARHRATGDARDMADIRRTLQLCFSRHVHPASRGWLDYFSREGALLEPVMPGMSVYHIFLGLTEAARALDA